MLELFYAQCLTGFALRPQSNETLDLSSGFMQLMRWSNIKIGITYVDSGAFLKTLTEILMNSSRQAFKSRKKHTWPRHS